MSESRTRISMRTLLVGALLFAAGFAVAALVLRDRVDRAAEPGADGEAAIVYTCSMHPQIRLPGPGDCPICGMDLIPLEDDAGGGAAELAMSPEAMALADILTVPVTRQLVEAEVGTVGRIAVDERRLRRVTARIGGRLDRMFVDYTGMTVQAGDHLVSIYSPELVSAQAELIEAARARDELAASPSAGLRETAVATLEASRRKLHLLGLSAQQIGSIESRGTAEEHVTLHSPVSGVVVEKNATEGEYVAVGSPICTIAELSQVWILLDVYESDLVWVHYGQSVTFQVEAYPGERFEGRIAFVDPVVDPRTRTVRVRVNADNPRLRLKPDMFVRAEIRSRILGDGRTLAPDLAGKWISPMHPEIVKDGPGSCDICGMPLVPAAELGFTTDSESAVPPLVIPASAPLLTGKRAIVYVRTPGRERATFEGREVVLGPRAGDFYVVLEGLAEGEEVVVQGNFKIDSAMQIQARPSMMDPDRPGDPAPEAPEAPEQSNHSHRGLDHPTDAFRGALAPVFRAYFSLQRSLAGDDVQAARAGVTSLRAAVDAVPAEGLDAGDRETWLHLAAELNGNTARAGGAGTLEAIRSALPDLTDVLLTLERSVGPPPGESHHLVFCPMAFENQGAFWLSPDSTVRNPYFGASMLRCGEVRESFGATSEGSR